MNYKDSIDYVQERIREIASQKNVRVKNYNNFEIMVKLSRVQSGLQNQYRLLIKTKNIELQEGLSQYNLTNGSAIAIDGSSSFVAQDTFITLNFIGEQDIYVPIPEALTIQSASETGTGTISYARSTDGISYSAITLPQSFNAGDKLKVSCGSDFSGHKAVTLTI